MRRFLLGAAIGLAAVAVAPIAAQTPASKPAAKAGELDLKNSLLNWHVAWPAEVSAIPDLLAAIRGPALKNRAGLLKTAAEDKADRTKRGYPFNAYESSLEVAVAGDSPPLLSLSGDWFEYTGGAHPNHGTKAILWDRKLKRQVTFDSLFTNGAGALETLLRKDYCAALDKERAKNRGPDESTDPTDMFNICPKFSKLALIPEGKAGKPFGSVMLHADPYVAGPYVEGDYDIALPVTAALVAALKPQYRENFAPAR
ncbi:MAG: PdaC/SigV domain-containing protein [Sphingomicrobium sp.]